MNKLLRRTFLVVLLLAGAGALVFALLPKPVEVDVEHAARAPMRVTVDEDGKTRIKERYIVSAPLAGRLLRVSLKPGDRVEAGGAVIAVIDPGDPALLDPRARAQAQARVSAADAALGQADAALARETAALERAQTDVERFREAARLDAANRRDLDDALTAEAIQAAAHRAAGFARDIARFELQQARAALMHFNSPADDPAALPDAADWRFEIRAPVSGRVLRVIHESSAVVSPGTPLIELGDPADLEAQIDVLSSEAVAIHPGAPVTFEQWGGASPLHGVVRLVEPSAFTKVSALGVEEQRVYVIIDFTDPPEERSSLGDGFRVEARIVVWEEQDILQIPVGSLFRDAQSWAVYTIEDGRARTRRVTLGRRNGAAAQVLSGLTDGEPVIAYPSDKVHPGGRVSERSDGSR